MGWAIGYDDNWQRDIGYGVPAYCDASGCSAEIDRGLAHVCGGEPYGGDRGCGLYFCGAHLLWSSGDRGFLCRRCCGHKPPYRCPKADHPQWVDHKLTHESWAIWRDEHPADVARLLELYADALYRETTNAVAGMGVRRGTTARKSSIVTTRA